MPANRYSRRTRTAKHTASARFDRQLMLRFPKWPLALCALALVVSGCSGRLTNRSTPSTLKGGVVPLAVVDDGENVRAYARVTIKGRAYLFVVDTGASRTVVTAQLASALGLPKHGSTFTEHSIGCTSTAQPVLISHWRLGRITLPPTAVAESHVHLGSQKVDGQLVVGLLGSDVLSQFGRATFEFHRQRLILGRNAPIGGRAVRFIALHSPTGAYAELARPTINGRPVTLAIDTGAEISYINGRSALRLHLKSLGWSGPIATLNGCRVTIHAVAIRHWTLGRVTLPSTYAAAGPISLKYRGQVVHGLLGSDVLATYRQVTFDFTDKRLVIQGPPKYTATSRDK
jgi:predicted aspartyl protease